MTADCGHDQFDEDCGPCWTRREWRGEESWLGIESIYGPRHTPGPDPRLEIKNMRGTRNDRGGEG